MEQQAPKHQQIIPLHQPAFTLTKPSPLRLTDRQFVRFCLRYTLCENHALALQTLRQQQGFNPNMLLYICWQSLLQHGRFKKAELSEILKQISDWRESVFRPLENILSDLQKKNTATAKELTQHINTELQQADIIEKCMFEDILLKHSSYPRSYEQQLQDICHGVAVYARILSARLTDDDIELFVKLFQSTLPDLCPKKVAKVTREKMQKVSADLSSGYAQLPLMLVV